MRQMPSESAIREYWAHRLWEAKGFDSEKEFLELGTCFACGFDWGAVERCHIRARVNGGSDGVENLHMLCPVCHQDSEFIEAERYWAWFKERRIADAFVSAAVRRGGFNVATALWGKPVIR